MALSQQSSWHVLLPSLCCFPILLCRAWGKNSAGARSPAGVLGRPTEAPGRPDPLTCGLGGQGGIRTRGGRQAGAGEPGRLQFSLQKPKRRRRRARGRGDKGDWPWGAGRRARGAGSSSRARCVQAAGRGAAQRSPQAEAVPAGGAGSLGLGSPTSTGPLAHPLRPGAAAGGPR